MKVGELKTLLRACSDDTEVWIAPLSHGTLLDVELRDDPVDLPDGERIPRLWLKTDDDT